MRSIQLTIVAALALGVAAGGSAPPVAAQRMQGTMRATVRSADGATMEFTQIARPGKAGFLVNDKGKLGGMIVDSAAGSMTMLDGDSKSYMVVSLATMQQMAERMGGMMKQMPHGQGNASDAEDSGGPKGKVTATGRTEVVAGIRCQVYTYDGMENGKHLTGEACLAKGAGMMAAGSSPMDMMPGMHSRDRSEMMQRRLAGMGDMGALLAQGYGIMKATGSEDGKFQGSMEVTALDRSLPPDAAFQPPAGYTKREMPRMPGAPN